MTRDLYDTVSSVGTIIGELQRSDARNDKANLSRFYKCLSYAEMSYRYSELKMDFSSEVDGETRMYNSDFTDRSEFLRHFILRECIIVIIIIDGNLLFVDRGKSVKCCCYILLSRWDRKTKKDWPVSLVVFENHNSPYSTASGFSRIP